MLVPSSKATWAIDILVSEASWRRAPRGLEHRRLLGNGLLLHCRLSCVLRWLLGSGLLLHCRLSCVLRRQCKILCLTLGHPWSSGLGKR